MSSFGMILGRSAITTSPVSWWIERMTNWKIGASGAWNPQRMTRRNPFFSRAWAIALMYSCVAPGEMSTVPGHGPDAPGNV